MVDYIDVRASTKYGNAVHSNRNLQPGDIILRETPLFAVQPPSTQHHSLMNSIFNAKNVPTQKLSPEERAEFRKVACVEDTDLPRFMCIHYEIRPKHNEPAVAFGLFPKGSYMNIPVVRIPCISGMRRQGAWFGWHWSILRPGRRFTFHISCCLTGRPLPRGGLFSRTSFPLSAIACCVMRKARILRCLINSASSATCIWLI